MEEVNLERVETGHQNIETQIVFVPSEQMRLRDVLGNHVATAFCYLCLLANDLDSAATTRGRWLHNVHVLVALNFSVDLPAFIVFREQVSHRTDVELLAVESPHALHVPPHQVLATDCPRSGKMIYPLVLVNVF